MNPLWFRRDLVRSYLVANPEAPDSWVQDALRTAHRIDVSGETVRRDRQLWGLPTSGVQRRHRLQGRAYAQAAPSHHTLAGRALGLLLIRRMPLRDLAAALQAPGTSVRAALKRFPYFCACARECRVRGGP
jgi:hypothetical protein